MTSIETKSQKIINEATTRIKMPKKLYIGDPLYFEEYENDASELKRLTYVNTFRRPDWIGSLKIVEGEETYQFNGKESTLKTIDLHAYFAPNEELLKLYEEDKKYKYQKVSTLQIGVDTAKYIIGFDDQEQTIRTGADGFWGAVYEYKNKGKLEGLTFDLGLGDLYSFDEAKKKLEYLFDTKFN